MFVLGMAAMGQECDAVAVATKATTDLDRNLSLFGRDLDSGNGALEALDRRALGNAQLALELGNRALALRHIAGFDALLTVSCSWLHLQLTIAVVLPLSRPCNSAHAFWLSAIHHRYTHAELVARDVPAPRACFCSSVLRQVVLHSRIAFIDFCVFWSSTKLSPEWMMSRIADGRTASRSLRKIRA